MESVYLFSPGTSHIVIVNVVTNKIADAQLSFPPKLRYLRKKTKNNKIQKKQLTNKQTKKTNKKHEFRDYKFANNKAKMIHFA